MTVATLVDTDILIDAGKEVPDAVKCLRELQAGSSIAISTVTELELIVGCRDKRELRSLDKFLQHFDRVQLNDGISLTATELLKEYRLSHGLLIPDGLIAATAIFMNMPLVSKNQKDYRFINELKLLPYPMAS
uniref:Ribonuclease VapC n=1 Tax=uncultured Thiotrichaceae bacterium TaxID=298394 RepID=A0A6S6U8B5_9GAMM|nr:MAG: Ribonuclease VapC [uncultured Thiotrichaceae bacterium]